MATQKKASKSTKKTVKEKKPVKTKKTVKSKKTVKKKSAVIAKKSTAKPKKVSKTKSKPKTVSTKKTAKNTEVKVVKKNTKKKSIEKSKPKKQKISVKVVDNTGINLSNDVDERDDIVNSFSRKIDIIEKDDNREEDFLSKDEFESDESDEVVKEINIKKEGNFLKFRSFNLYRKIAFSFILLTVVLLFSVFYFSFSSVTITLSPKVEHVSDNLIMDVYNSENNKSNSEYAIKGIVERAEIEIEKTYKSTGREIVDEKMVGSVVIVNNYSKDQPLVKTTRLLSSEGILYRTSDTVNVPAGGEVKVDVYVDDPSKDKQLGLTEFTIPGLWAGLQDKIYAKNSKPIVYKTESEQYVQQRDIDNAIKDIEMALIDKVNEKFDSDNSSNIVVYKIENDSMITRENVDVGDKKEKFKVTGTVIVQVVAFGNSNIDNLARKKLLISMEEDKILSKLNKDDIKYSLNNFNIKDETASIKASFSGDLKYKSGASVIDKNKIVGLSKIQLEAYLEGLNSFSSFDIKFSPTFIKKVPNLTDKIEIRVK